MILIPSFLIILTVKDDWLIKNLSFIVFKHLSIIAIPCSSVISWIYWIKYFCFESIHDTACQKFSISVCGFSQFNNSSKIIQPEKSWLITFKSCKKTVDWVGSFSDSFSQFSSDVIGSVIDWQFDSIFVLKICEIFLNVVTEDQNIRMFTSEGK